MLDQQPPADKPAAKKTAPRAKTAKPAKAVQPDAAPADKHGAGRIGAASKFTGHPIVSKEGGVLALPINLALQGGGSHGAFTWGVLDALLENRSLWFEAVSGTSAGAMNAVVMAYGYSRASADFADEVEAHEAGCESARVALRQFWEGVGTMGSLMSGIPQAGKALMDMMTQWLSPYQTNPLDINPLRRLLENVVDFDFLQKHKGKNAAKVFVCATNVRTGKGEVFTGSSLTADAVMASACLPMMYQAVEIKDQYYWDGGYSGNPLIYPLIYQTANSDVLLVQLNPIAHDELPSSSQEIMDRMNEITFNASLLAELRAMGFVRRLLDEGRLDRDRYKYMLMHHIDGGAQLKTYGASSKTRADTPFLRELFVLGRAAGERWLAEHRADVGVRASFKI